VLDDFRRAREPEPARTIHRLLHQLLVGHVIERTDFTNLATIDDEAEYFGFAY
jgi:hypothetical protein